MTNFDSFILFLRRHAPAVGRYGALGLAFGIGLFGTAAILGSSLRFPVISPVREKIQYFVEHEDRFDTLLIGSSRAYRQIDPALLDQLMAKAGKPIHTYNLGIDGMTPPEDLFVMEKALARRTKPLKYVIGECYRIPDVYIAVGQEGTLRHAYWHDWRRFLYQARALTGPKIANADGKRWSYRVGFKALCAVGPHLRLFLTNCVHLGRGRDWFVPEQSMGDLCLGPKRDGFYPTESVIDDKGFKDLNEQMEAYMTWNAGHRFGNWASQDILLEKRQLVEKHQAKYILFTPPSCGDNFYPIRAITASIPLLDFTDPRRYPELFIRPNRYDHGHLNHKGAEVFTRLIAEKLAGL